MSQCGVIPRCRPIPCRHTSQSRGTVPPAFSCGTTGAPRGLRQNPVDLSITTARSIGFATKPDRPRDRYSCRGAAKVCRPVMSVMFISSNTRSNLWFASAACASAPLAASATRTCAVLRNCTAMNRLVAMSSSTRTQGLPCLVAQAPSGGTLIRRSRVIPAMAHRRCLAASGRKIMFVPAAGMAVGRAGLPNN